MLIRRYRSNHLSLLALLLLCLMLLMPGAMAADSIGEPGRGTDGPNPLNNVYFGEQHLHTSASPDAFAFGTRNDANEAYRSTPRARPSRTLRPAR
jgi:hypothetical protein